MTPLVEAVVRAVDARQQREYGWRGPVYLTEAQAKQVLHESGQEMPDDWYDQVAAGFEGSTVLGLPVRLASTVEESTPYTEGWISA